MRELKRYSPKCKNCKTPLVFVRQFPYFDFWNPFHVVKGIVVGILSLTRVIKDPAQTIYRCPKCFKYWTKENKDVSEMFQSNI